MTAIGILILGLFIGSFLNVLIDRIPQDEDVIHGRSHCDHCHRTLAWYELIPILSYIVQGGRSRCCRRKLSLQYPLVELVTGILFAGSYFWLVSQAGPAVTEFWWVRLASVWVVLGSLIVIFMTDAKGEIIPTAMIISGLFGTFVYLGASSSPFPVLLTHHLLPAALAALFFFLLWFLSRGRAMGDGDISLVFLLAMFSGYPQTVVGLYVAFLTGALAGVILMVSRKKSLKSHIPFGPFLIAGFIAADIWGMYLLRLWRIL